LSALAGLMAALVTARLPAVAAETPWGNRALSPDARATLVEARMTVDEMLQMVDGKWAVPHTGALELPPGALGSAGFIPGVARLGIPNLQESDAGMGVADPVVSANRTTVRGSAGYATTLPSGLATAATWNPDIAYAGGAMIGREAWDQGFNVLLAGGVNLAREPRNGRTFEYAGEDPLLAGTIAGWTIRGIEDQHVIATTKHFALNDQETDRQVLSADIAPGAARESDLLAFETAIGIGSPGAVMCAYNRVNSISACANDYLLNQTLKRDWHFAGWVMSDWGAVHASADASSGLDQESGDYFDQLPYFAAPLREAILDGRVSRERLADMVHRILRSMFAAGLFDNAQATRPLDADADAAVAEADEEQAAVLLKNGADVLPLSHGIASIAVIGEHADVGVLSGGGSAQVWPLGGPAIPPNDYNFPNPVIWDPSSPLRAIAARTRARVVFESGADPAAAAAAAAAATVAIIFVNQWMAESIDEKDLSLPNDQDALIERVAAANPRTIVVLETGGPVVMPWLADVRAVLEAWYPGARGGPAIARLLFGDVSPSGRLPLTFPASVAQLPRPTISPGRVDYDVEGSDVGYKWFEARRLQPLFPFGFGLTYARFAYSHLRVEQVDGRLTAHFDVTNVGERAAPEVAQLYLRLPTGSGADAPRLVGWQKLTLAPGQTRTVDVTVDQKLEATFEATADDWRIAAGRYRLSAGPNVRDSVLSAWATQAARRIAP
jgi:beta-glucosidase